MVYRLAQQDALLIIDVQNDFLEGGGLAVPGADEIIPVINSYIEIFKRASLPIFASRDWHPADHCSFQQYGGPWPSHCVAGTFGAEFSADLKLPPHTRIISKATNVEKEAYSDFDETDLTDQLKSLGVRRLFVCGLATDYCVLNTVRDALARNYNVMLLQDAIRAVNLKPDDGDKARAEMRALGAVEIILSRIV
jgi:nicotinamidase/pyrazinamidase